MEEAGRRLTLTTHLRLVLKAQTDCVRKSRNIEGCSACPACDNGFWRWEYLRATLWGLYSFLLLFCSSPSSYFLIFIFTSYNISRFIPFSYFSHSYYFISYLRRSVSFRSVFTCLSRSLKLTAHPQAVSRLRLYAVTVCVETTSRLLSSFKFPIYLILQQSVDVLMYCYTWVEANPHALRSQQEDRSPYRPVSCLENCMVIPVTSLLDVT